VMANVSTTHASESSHSRLQSSDGAKVSTRYPNAPAIRTSVSDTG
jgi:hypothetical protein